MWNVMPDAFWLQVVQQVAEANLYDLQNNNIENERLENAIRGAMHSMSGISHCTNTQIKNTREHKINHWDCIKFSIFRN